MDAATQNKNERINLRVKSSAKRLIARAADFEGKSVSHFILTSALKRAEETVKEHQMMTLNTKNSRAFFDALAAPKIQGPFSMRWPLRCVLIAN